MYPHVWKSTVSTAISPFIFVYSFSHDQHFFFLLKALLLDLLSLKLSSLGQASHRAMFTLSATVVSSANTLLKYHQSIHLGQRELWNQFSEQSKCYPVTMYLCTKLFHLKSSDINLGVAIDDIIPVFLILFQFATDLQYEHLEFIIGQLSSEIKDCVDLFSIMHIICSSIFCITYKSPRSNTTLTSRALPPESLHAELFYDTTQLLKSASVVARERLCVPHPFRLIVFTFVLKLKNCCSHRAVV